MKRRYLALITSSIMSLSLITGCGKSSSQSSAPEESVAAMPSVEDVIPTATPEPTGAPETTKTPEETDVAEVTETPTVEPTETPENKEESEPTATPTATPTVTATPSPTAQAQPTAAEVQPTAAEAQPTAVAEQPQPTAVAEQPQTTPAPTQAAAQSQSVSSMSFDDKCDASYNTRGELAPHSTVYINGVAYEFCGENPANGVVVDDPKWYNHEESALMSADELYEKCWTYEEDPVTGTLKQTRHDDWIEDADMRDYRYYWVIERGGDYDGYYF